MVWLKSTPAGSKSIAKRAVGRWCLVAIDGANTTLLKLSKSTQKCTNRSAERERAQGSATAHSALLPLRLKWKAVIKEEHHNHDPSPEPTSHPSHRRGIVETNHGRQGDFKGPVQHEAEGQKCSTWRPD